MSTITKITGTKLAKLDGWQIEGIKFGDPCAGGCSDTCESKKCDFWTNSALGSWGPSSELINTWAIC